MKKVGKGFERNGMEERRNDMIKFDKKGFRKMKRFEQKR